MTPAEPTVVAPEAVFEAALIEAVRGMLAESGHASLCVPRFGLDLALFIESPGGVRVRLVEVKVYIAQRQGGVGFGNQRGEGPQVELLSCTGASAQLLRSTVRWVLADATLPPGTARYALFDCATAKAAAMGVVERGKQNNLRVRSLQPLYATWADLLSKVREFLLE